MHTATGFALAALVAQSLADLPTISAKGAKFFDSNGSQFYIKGVAYQLTEDDPLISTEQCQLDASLMKTLGANSIRVYHVDSSANHDGCMQAFADAGIYAWIDLDTFSTYILPNKPAWTQDQYSAYSAVMDTFHGYSNVAGFFVGNEVLSMGNQSIAAPYVKAAARDMKAYRDSKGYRQIPIGYSAADIPSLRPNLQNYMACGSNSSDALDFFGLNAYEWCGDSTYSTSGYSQLQQNATDYNIPIFFSETGCNTPEPRTFADQSAILGSDMDGTWSGAIIYEWIQEHNSYGLISYATPVAATATGSGIYDGYVRTGTPTPIQPDFSNLSNQWKTLNPTGTSESAYSPSLTPPACPSFTSVDWEVQGDVPLPTLGQTYNAENAASITGSQTGGPSSTGGSSSPTKSSSASSMRARAEGTASAVIVLGVSAMASVLGMAVML